MNDREKFEMWLRAEWPGLWVGRDEYEARFAAEVAESAYQAGRKQMAEEAAAVCMKQADGSRVFGNRLGAYAAAACAAAIRSLATPTEGKT